MRFLLGLLFVFVLSIAVPAFAEEMAFKVGRQVFDFDDPKQTNGIAITIDAPLEPITGVASGVRGTATFDPDNPRATVGTISVAVSSLRFPNEGYTQTARFYGLNENKFPDVTCTLKSIKSGKVVSRTPEQCVYQGTVAVDFTCKGVTRALTVPLKVVYLRGIANQRGPNFEGDVINVRSDFTIRRSDFGIAPEAVPNLVAEEVGIRVAVVGIANRKAARETQPKATTQSGGAMEQAPLKLTVGGKPFTLAERMAVHQVPGCSVVQIKAGKVVGIWSQGEAAPGRSVDGRTLFPVGALSHSLIAAAMLRAAADGSLDLDKEIDSYSKTWKTPPMVGGKEGRPIRLRDLLENRSGFAYAKYMGYERGKAIPSLLQVLKGEKPAQTPPAIPTAPAGTYGYAMENYAVLQQVIEDATGQDFNSVMQGWLLEPLGMKESVFCSEPPQSLQDRVAIGHDDVGKPIVGGWRVYPEVAASGLWVTPEEVADAFAELLRCLQGEGNYLKAGVAKELIRPVAKNQQDDDPQAIAFGITDWDGVKVIYRGGNAEGFYCQLYANPQKGNACIVLTNRNLCWKFANEVFSSVDWR